jgi:NAD(P)-dependent dehydrogenase (short-subunit alcohol dehydrogenase family)
MDKRLDGRVALIFGAGSVGAGWGNGKAAAVAFARQGAKVIAVDLKQEAADETRDIIRGEGGYCESYAADVTRADQVQSVVKQTLAAHARIDVLHNNVGLAKMGDVVDLSEKDWDLMLDVNLKSIFLTCKYVLPPMLAARKGVVINISSLAGIRYTGYPYAAYYAAKGGVNQLTVGLALQYAGSGIRVNAIVPGYIDTPLIYQNIAGQYRDKEEMVAARNALCPMGRMGTAWDIANAAVFLASDEASYITGVCLPVDGGVHARVA